MTHIEKAIANKLKAYDIRPLKEYNPLGWNTIKAYGKLRRITQIEYTEGGNSLHIEKIKYYNLGE